MPKGEACRTAEQAPILRSGSDRTYPQVPIEATTPESRSVQYQFVTM
jgi:hypothetical protein